RSRGRCEQIREFRPDDPTRAFRVSDARLVALWFLSLQSSSVPCCDLPFLHALGRIYRHKKLGAKNKKPTYPDFLARGLWNFSVYGGSKSAAASGQKCDVRDSNSSRSNNTRSGETYASVQRVRG